MQHYPDHFVVGIDDLEKGIELFENLTGVKATPGGIHPHIGTCNALVSLGKQSYLEIIAPNPLADPALLDLKLKAQFMDPLRDMDSLTPYLWAVGSSDLDQTVAVLAAKGILLSNPEKGSRKKPNGEPLEWRASFISRPAFPAAPFFIQWLDPSMAPPVDSPTGCLLERFWVAGPEQSLLETTTQTLALDAQTGYSPEPRIEVMLNCPRGQVTLSSK